MCPCAFLHTFTCCYKSINTKDTHYQQWYTHESRILSIFFKSLSWWWNKYAFSYKGLTLRGTDTYHPCKVSHSLSSQEIFNEHVLTQQDFWFLYFRAIKYVYNYILSTFKISIQSLFKPVPDDSDLQLSASFLWDSDSN